MYFALSVILGHVYAQHIYCAPLHASLIHSMSDFLRDRAACGPTGSYLVHNHALEAM